MELYKIYRQLNDKRWIQTNETKTHQRALLYCKQITFNEIRGYNPTIIVKDKKIVNYWDKPVVGKWNNNTCNKKLNFKVIDR